nr:helix-turn-helix transcriptional regulator [uncultured Celeribacter sp.]
MGTQIRIDQIEQSVQARGLSFAATRPSHQVVLTGARHRHETQSGLTVTLFDAQTETDFETRATRPAGVVIHMVLEGQVNAWLDGREMGLSRAPGEPVRILFSALSEPLPFRRQANRGDVLRKLTVTLEWDWLAARGFDMATVMAGRRAIDHSWIATPSELSDAEHIFQQAAQDDTCPALRAMATESFAMRLVQHALSTLLTRADGLSPRERSQLQRMERLAAEPGPLPSAQMLARAGGMSVSSMRRLFRRAYDAPVQTRLRGLRLDHAAEALRAGATVEDAARIAGYESAPAFSTAFRHRYGMAPSVYRRG